MTFDIRKLLFMGASGEIKRSLVKKVILGYVIIILLPTVLLTAMLQIQFYNRMINEYAKQKQQFLERAHTNLRLDLTKLESVQDFFQYNLNLVEYMSGFYTSDAEAVYAFVKYIEPLVSFVTVGVPSINDVKFYHYNGGKHILSLGSLIFKAEKLDDHKDLMAILPSGGKGIWVYEPHSGRTSLPDLTFYEQIFDKDFRESIGFIKIQAKDSVLLDFVNDLSALSEGFNSVTLFDKNSNIIYRRDGNGIALNDHDKLKLISYSDFDEPIRIVYANKRFLINSVTLPVLNIRVATVQDENTILGGLDFYLNGIIFYVLGLFALLSVTYYFITSNMTKRILGLAKHMREIDDKNLLPYERHKGHDEIGFLISIFNSMILRLDELILNVHRTELLRKEAAYAAMQAQVKPHFLYGTLEAIRMLAESNDDREVSNAIYTFGRLIRYSLSSDKMEVLLSDELEHVKNYLEIHKLRMGDRLEYQFDISVDPKTFKCPRFILQPLVENSIVHGLSGSRGRGIIKVSASENEQHIILSVIDNGIGVTEDKLNIIRDMLENRLDIKDFQTDISGFGLYSISERIKAYYGQASKLIFSSKQEQGAELTLLLQKSKSNGNMNKRGLR